ncbi:MAG: RNA polymerase sigma factor [Oscillospiraceae bacterium]|nr:RNA polymerase sigma factor [Oscillospiraceae bacterium]
MEQAQMAEIYDRLHDDVYRVALTCCRNVQDAEDVTHDVFLIRFQREEPFPDADAEKAWMLRVAINRSRDLFRRFRRRDTVSLEQAGEIPAKTEAELAVWEAVNALPEQYRVIIHLYYFEGYTVREIAEITNASETAVQTRLARARKRLQKMLGEEFTP